MESITKWGAFQYITLLYYSPPYYLATLKTRVPAIVVIFCVVCLLIDHYLSENAPRLLYALQQVKSVSSNSIDLFRESLKPNIPC